jgi:hypothetical protein
MHRVALTHDTPSRKSAAESGFGLGTTCHDEPSHASMSVTLFCPESSQAQPTAVQLVVLRHDDA